MYEHLKDLRESLGMTQAEFGKSVGVAKSTYNNYETGIRDPKSDFWISVARKYSVTIDYLMGYSNDPLKTYESQPCTTAKYPMVTAEAQKIAQAYENADAGTQAAVCKLLDVSDPIEDSGIEETFAAIKRELEAEAKGVAKSPALHDAKQA